MSNASMLCNRRSHLLAVALLSALTGACSEPTSYNDCILKYVKERMDRAAVAVVMRSCREKFPEGGTAPKPEPSIERPLTAQELDRLDGRAGRSFGNFYSGTLYNGNSDVTITELEITLTTKIGSTETSRPYRTQVSIPPRSAGTFRFSILAGDEGASYRWSISGGKGSPQG